MLLNFAKALSSISDHSFCAGQVETAPLILDLLAPAADLEFVVHYTSLDTVGTVSCLEFAVSIDQIVNPCQFANENSK